MPCTSPLNAYKSRAGGVTFKRDVNTTEQLQLPCGQCMDCKLERSRQWAIRMLHEASLHDENYALTLTYKPELEPRGLEKTHIQKFWKRVRKDQTKQYGTSPRHYTCGEYGELQDRPHYHAAAFNLRITDLEHYSGEGERELFTSKYIDTLWGYGATKIGRMNKESAMYIAAYVTKKLNISAKTPDETRLRYEAHYERIDPATGELYTRAKEFAVMSLRPAIGRPWLERYTDDVYNHDHVVVAGKTGKPPRYYDKYLEQTQPTRLEKWKKERKLKAIQHTEDNTTARLKVKATITKARLNLKRKTL